MDRSDGGKYRTQLVPGLDITKTVQILMVRKVLKCLL